MGVTPVGTGVTGSSTKAQDTPAYPAGWVVGTFLSAIVNTKTGTTTIDMPGWTAQLSSPGGNGMWWFTRVVDATDTGTAEIDLSVAESHGWAIEAYEGADPATPVDVAAVASTGSGTSAALAGVTTVTPDARVLSGLATGGATGNSITGVSSPLVIDANNDSRQRAALASGDQATAGPTGTVTWTKAGTVAWAGFVTALRPTGGAPPAPAEGTASTPWTAAASATGEAPAVPPAEGTASTSWAAAASTTGEAPAVPPAEGTASTTWTATASAVGSAPSVPPAEGTASTPWTATASATGQAPAVPPAEGTASATWAATASATGEAPAIPPAEGTASTSWAAVASAVGVDPGSLRDISVTVGATAVDWTGGPTFSDWSAAAVTGNPASAGPVADDDAWAAAALAANPISAGPVSGDDTWEAAPVTAGWSAGPVYTQE